MGRMDKGRRMEEGRRTDEEKSMGDRRRLGETRRTEEGGKKIKSRQKRRKVIYTNTRHKEKTKGKK